jgi:hypothetical protein
MGHPTNFAVPFRTCSNKFGGRCLKDAGRGPNQICAIGSAIDNDTAGFCGSHLPLAKTSQID